MITANDLKAECLRRQYQVLLQQAHVFPSARNWGYIISEHMSGLGKMLYRKYLVALMCDPEQQNEFHLAAIRHFPEYLQVIDRDEAVDVIFSDFTTNPKAFVDLVHRCDLFCAERICAILDNDDCVETRQLTVSLLDAMQAQYDIDDLKAMEQLQQRLKSLEPLGVIEEKKTLLGNTRRYICARGHANSEASTYCGHDDCGIDLYGFTEADRAAIEKYDMLVSTLREMLEAKINSGG